MGVRGRRGTGELGVLYRRGVGALGVSGRRGVGAGGAGRGRAGRAAWAWPGRWMGGRLGQLGQFWCTVHLAQFWLGFWTRFDSVFS